MQWRTRWQWPLGTQGHVRSQSLRDCGRRIPWGMCYGTVQWHTRWQWPLGTHGHVRSRSLRDCGRQNPQYAGRSKKKQSCPSAFACAVLSDMLFRMCSCSCLFSHVSVTSFRNLCLSLSPKLRTLGGPEIECVNLLLGRRKP